MEKEKEQQPRLMSSREVAERLGISRETVNRLVHDYAIPCYQIGKRFKFRPDEVEEYISKNRIELPLLIVRRKVVKR